MDLRCPICKSSRINYYGTSTTMGGGYRSADAAEYVCEDCGYAGALILDVSDDIDEKAGQEVEKDLEKIKKEMDEEDKNKNPVESDLKEIKKEMGDLYNKSIKTPIVSQEPIPIEIKNILAGELYDFIVYAKRTVSIFALIIQLGVSLFLTLFFPFSIFVLIWGAPNIFISVLMLFALFVGYLGIDRLKWIISGEAKGSAWFIGTPKSLIIYPKDKKISSLGQGELANTIGFNSTQKECFIKISWKKLKSCGWSSGWSKESGDIEIVTKVMIQPDEGGPYPATICIGGIKNADNIGQIIRKRIEENNPINNNSHLFLWEDVPENNTEFIEFLNKDMYISWVENAKIKKSDNNEIIDVTDGEKSIILKLNKREKKVSYFSDVRENKRYIGRSTYYYSLKEAGGKLSVCY